MKTPKNEKKKISKGMDADNRHSGSGGATIKQPDGGFNDTAVASIFATTVARAASTASSTSSATSSSTGSSSSSGSSNTGGIVGGVVGGVAGLALIGLIGWLVLRRRKRNAGKGEIVSQTDEGAYGENHQMGTAAYQGGYGGDGYAQQQQTEKRAELDPGTGVSEADGRVRVVGEADGREILAPVEMEGDSPKVERTES